MASCPAGAQRSANGPAVHAGQHHVQHNQRVRLRGGEIQTRSAVARPVHDVALLLQSLLDRPADAFLVLDQQNSHAARWPHDSQ
jgi:hypothetical protein